MLATIGSSWSVFFQTLQEQYLVRTIATGDKLMTSIRSSKKLRQTDDLNLTYKDINIIAWRIRLSSVIQEQDI
jgi:hypothetical protein